MNPIAKLFLSIGAISGIRVLGAITLIGGLCFIAGWCCWQFQQLSVPDQNSHRRGSIIHLNHPE
jgi:hypothetical protein